MLTYLYVRCALGQGSRSSLAKFFSFNDLELAKGQCSAAHSLIATHLEVLATALPIFRL